jgi:hypothetical protein
LTIGTTVVAATVPTCRATKALLTANLVFLATPFRAAFLLRGVATPDPLTASFSIFTTLYQKRAVFWHQLAVVTALESGIIYL